MESAQPVVPQCPFVEMHRPIFYRFGTPTSFPSTLLPYLEHLEGHWSNVARLVEDRPAASIT